MRKDSFYLEVWTRSISKEVLATNLVKDIMKDVTIREANYGDKTILSVSIVVEDLFKLSDINQELSKQGGNK